MKRSMNTRMMLSAVSVARWPKPGGREKLKGTDTLCTSILGHGGDHPCSPLLAFLAQCLLDVFFRSLSGQSFGTKRSCGQIKDDAISRARAQVVAPLHGEESHSLISPDSLPCSNFLTSVPARCHSHPAQGWFIPLPPIEQASLAFLRPTQGPTTHQIYFFLFSLAPASSEVPDASGCLPGKVSAPSPVNHHLSPSERDHATFGSLT